jgi:hypothetical protein
LYDLLAQHIRYNQRIPLYELLDDVAVTFQTDDRDGIINQQVVQQRFTEIFRLAFFVEFQSFKSILGIKRTMRIEIEKFIKEKTSP